MKALLIQSFLRTLSYLPLRRTHQLATALGKLLYRFPNNSISRVTRINVQQCFPALAQLENCPALEVLIQQSLIETCKTFMELGALWCWSKPQLLGLVQQVSGEDCLHTALQQGKGVILLTPHLGAWEMAGLYASSRATITSLYRPPKLAALENFIQQGRQRLGAKLVPTDSAGLKALFQGLKRGEIVGILPDQVPKEVNGGVFAPFLGEEAYTMSFVARLAQKSGAPVIFTFAERLAEGKGFHLHFLPAPVAIASSDLVEASTALNQGVERCLSQCPAQYQWSYKRFKQRPPDLKILY